MRFHNLDKIYASIPKEDDITWHISKIKSRPYNHPSLQDGRVRLYDIECKESDTITKRNVIFNNIHDGYFCLLDDDTIFHPNMYKLYTDALNGKYKPMMIGVQVHKNGKLRLGSLPVPVYVAIDTGNVLCYHSVLRHVKWAFDPSNRSIAKDFVFWDNVYKFYKESSPVPMIISIYNALR